MIVLVDVSKKGEVTHRLRGHDNEIHSLAWSPVTGEPALYSRAEDDPGSAGRSGSGPYRGDFNGLCGSAADGASAGERGCYLASGSKDHTVRIWSTAKGKGEDGDLLLLLVRGAGLLRSVHAALVLQES